MANKKIFSTTKGKMIASANVINEAGGTAYGFAPEHALAQLAVTGCFNGVYYADAGDQLERVLALAQKASPQFVAKTAIYSRERGNMKDMPALLCAVLSNSDVNLCKKVFNRVIDNGKMLRTFVQVVRSGATGRKSLGSAPKKLVNSWLESRSDEAVFSASVGNDPSLSDVIKMVHPKPSSVQRESLYAFLLGREYNIESLPYIVRQFEDFKSGKTDIIPNIPFQFLTSLNISEDGWKKIAFNASWTMTRMNLNTFARHGVFKSREITEMIAARISNRDLVIRAKAFPYQLLIAYRMAGDEIPLQVRFSLQDALEISIENVPAIDGKVYVCPDVSGSMQSPVTGVRKGATTQVRCIDVAALMAAAVLRRNSDAEVIPFSDGVLPIKLNPRDSVMSNAEKLASLPGGGTCCSAPIKTLNKKKADGAMIIMISDNQSWIETVQNKGSRITATMTEWQEFKYRNQDANLVCIDLQPFSSTQAQERTDILNVGGFSDHVFEIVSLFAKNEMTGSHWVDRIEKVEI